MKRESAFRLPMQSQTAHGQVIPMPKGTQPPAGGGCGRPAAVRAVPPMSVMTGRFIALVVVSSVTMTACARLCGSIWTLNSSNSEPSNNAIVGWLICGSNRDLYISVKRRAILNEWMVGKTGKTDRNDKNLRPVFCKLQKN